MNTYEYMNISINKTEAWVHKHKHALTHLHAHKDIHILWLWSYPKGMFCVEVTVQLGLACLRAACLETEGDILPPGSMSVCTCVSVCVSVKLSQRQVRMQWGWTERGHEQVINFKWAL